MPQSERHEFERLLDGGSASIVAIAVGTSEGTRTPQGAFTVAWWGHTDPGNGALNVGSFSWQHGGEPGKADAAQLEKFCLTLLPIFLRKGLSNPVHFAVACDVFTQSELACMARDGFLDQLVLNPSNLVECRVRAYFDPNTGRLDAPGFQNNIDRLRADQERRTESVLSALSKQGIQIA